MTLTQKITLALGLFAAAGASFAQTNPTGAAPDGLLGQRYAEFSYQLQEIDFVPENLHSAGFAANVPLSPSLDLTASYSYSWIRGAIDGHANTVGAIATAYTSWEGVKPFFGAGLGYQWSRAAGFSDDTGLWALTAGFEIPLRAFTFTPRIAYGDDFESGANSSEQLTYEVQGNYWFTDTLAGYAGIGYTDVFDTDVDTWNYTVGLRLKF